MRRTGKRSAEPAMATEGCGCGQKQKSGIVLPSFGRSDFAQITLALQAHAFSCRRRAWSTIRQGGGADDQPFAAHRLIVEPHRATWICRRACHWRRQGRRSPTMTASRCPRPDQRSETSTVGKVSANAPSSQVLRAVSAACSAALQAMHDRRRLGCQHLLGVVDLGTAQRFQPRGISGPAAGGVKIFRNRPTSASSVLRQYCQKS